MFAKLLSLASAFAILAVATPTPGGSSGEGSGSTCSSGTAQCCQNVYTPSSAEFNTLLSLIDVVVGDVVGDIASGCQNLDVNVIGSTCSSNSVCCQDTSHSLVSVSCVTL